MVLATLVGVLFGAFLNNHVFHDGHEINWIVVACGSGFIFVYAVIWAVVRIKNQDKMNDNQ